MLALEILLIPVVGIMDRFRGDDDRGWSKNVDATIQGALIGYLAGFALDWTLVVFALSFALAMAISYGGPWGAAVNDREMDQTSDDWPWWQVGIFRRNVLLALTLRGLIGAAVLLPICYLVGAPTPPWGILAGFTVAPFLSRWLLQRGWVSETFLTRWIISANPSKLGWNLAEFLRGVIMASICLF